MRNRKEREMQVKCDASFKDRGSFLIGLRLHRQGSLWETEMGSWKASPPSNKGCWKICSLQKASDLVPKPELLVILCYMDWGVRGLNQFIS